MSAGKGDKPRNCFSKTYKDNYDSINWKSSPESGFKDSVKEKDSNERSIQDLQNSKPSNKPS